MPAKWPWNLPKRSNSGYLKELEGIRYTPELKKLVEKCVDNAGSSSDSKDTFYGMDKNDAVAAVNNFHKLSSPPAIPLDIIRAVYSLIESPSELETALQSAKSLEFTPAQEKSSEESNEERRWRRRMDRLRLRAEEKRYQRLTSNLDHEIADDVTTRSMTYAASVGLNMIVAPISFGVFMYFFAGHIFTWLTGKEDEDPRKADMRKIITGVVCGVLMLFIEMILFVIRTYAMDASMAKKAKTKKVSPFGYTKPVEVAKKQS